MAQLLQQLNPQTATVQGPSSQGGTQVTNPQEGAGPSGSGQANGTTPGGGDPAAGLSQEALQQLYLQLLQSNPFLTPLACNLAALSMGLPSPTTTLGGAPSLAALFPGFNFAAATPGGGQVQGGREQQQAVPVQGGPFAGIFQAPAGQPGGGFADHRPFGHPLQAAQIFLHPGGPIPPQVFPPDANLRHRGGQNGAQAVPPLQPMAQFGMPQGVPIVVRVRRIQIDFMLIAKLAVIVFVLNQDGSIPRLVLLTFLAVMAYLYQTGVLTPYIRLGAERFQRMLQQQGRQQAPAGVNQGAPVNPGNAPNPAAGGALAGAVQRQRAGGGILREIQLFVMGFITSLLPGFQPPEAMPEPGQVPPPQGVQGGVPADERPHRD